VRLFSYFLLELQRSYMEHGEPMELWQECGFDNSAIVRALKDFFEVKKNALAV